MMGADELSKFLLQDRSAKVIAVSLSDTWQAAQTHQDLPPAIRQLLGELVAAATLLAANLKFDGSLLLQLKGKGPLKMVVVECRHDLSLRATVKLQRPLFDHETDLQSLLNADGQGHFSLIINPPPEQATRQAYQGIVPLIGDSVAQVLQTYMAQSEQLETRLWLSSDPSCAAGLLLQRMPLSSAPGAMDESSVQTSWEEAVTLCNTLTPKELIQTSTDTLLHRLFWQNPVLSLEKLPVQWRCSCERERVSAMLRSLGAQEVNGIVKEQGSVTVTCEFCGTPYVFDAVDVTSLFREQPQPASNSTLH